MSLDEREQHRITPDEQAEVGRALSRCTGIGDILRIGRLGGLTNRIFEVVTTTSKVAVRLPGPGTEAYIDREAELTNAQIASDMGIGSRIVHASGGVLVTEFIDGEVLSPERVRSDADSRVGIAALLRRLHDSGQPFATHFDPLAVIAAHRRALGEVPAGTDETIARIRALRPPPQLVPCHNDPWPENFIDTGDRLHLLDWEYSGMGDPAWDLADVAVEADLDRAARSALLDAYVEAGNGPKDSGLRARVDDLAPVTDLLWGLWALVQDQDGNRSDDWIPYARHRLDRAARAQT